MKLAFGHELGTESYQDIEVSVESRLRSCHLIGSSDSGKSSMMESWQLQDVHDDVGHSVFDIEDRLAKRAVRHLVDADREFVVIDPSITSAVMPLNVLAVPPGIHPQTVVEGVLQAARRAWWNEWGPRLEDLFRHSLFAFVEAGLTLAELPHFLSNESFRTRVAQQSKDARVRSYFLDHLRNVPAREWRTWVESTRNKVAAFASNPFIEPAIAAETCIDFQALMDVGTPIIINLPEAVLGDSGKLLGMLLISRFFQASLRRKFGSRPHFAFIDEFQNFATKSLVDLVMRGRKRGFGAVLAHQTIHQPPFDQNPDFLSAILGSTAINVVMQVGREDAERFAKEVFPATGTQPKQSKKDWLFGEFVERGTPNYSVNEEREHQYRFLEGQRQREAFIKVKDRMQGATVYAAEAYEVPEPSCTEEDAERASEAQISRLGVPVEVIRASRDARLARFQPQRTGRRLSTAGD